MARRLRCGEWRTLSRALGRASQADLASLSDAVARGVVVKTANGCLMLWDRKEKEYESLVVMGNGSLTVYNGGDDIWVDGVVVTIQDLCTDHLMTTFIQNKNVVDVRVYASQFATIEPFYR